jgi:hypothetical protein
MLLKGCLCQTVSLAEMKSRFSHKLVSLWGAFKAAFPGADLSPFDDVVANLDRFEQIRYPDAIVARGVSITVGWGPSHTFGATTDAFLPCYKLSVSEMDDLMARIFSLYELDHRSYTAALNVEARRALETNNSHREVWFPPCGGLYSAE